MERRKRAITKAVVESEVSHLPGEVPGACVVCGARDARLLARVELRGGAETTLCGSHALFHSRTGEASSTVEELRARLGDRRLADRRRSGEGDELAERLIAAFSRDRRGPDRRMN